MLAKELGLQGRCERDTRVTQRALVLRGAEGGDAI